MNCGNPTNVTFQGSLLAEDDVVDYVSGDSGLDPDMALCANLRAAGVFIHATNEVEVDGGGAAGDTGDGVTRSRHTGPGHVTSAGHSDTPHWCGGHQCPPPAPP